MPNAQRRVSDSGSPSLLERVAAGEQEAMKQCIAQYGGLIWSLVRKYCYNQQEAEDVSQEVFLNLWKSASRFDPERSSEKTFIALIARRRSIDWLRKQQSQPNLENLEPEMLEKQLNSQQSIPNNHSVDLEELQLSIETLPEDTKQLFDYHFRLGLTHQQLAERLKLPLGTVKSKLRSGIILLRNRHAKSA